MVRISAITTMIITLEIGLLAKAINAIMATKAARPLQSKTSKFSSNLSSICFFLELISYSAALKLKFLHE